MFGKSKRKIEELKNRLSLTESELAELLKVNRKLLEVKEDNDKLIEQLSKCKQCSILQDVNNKISIANQMLISTKNQIKHNKTTIEELSNDIIELKDKQLFQTFGIYDPIYIDKCPAELKELINKCRDKQKKMVKDNTFYVCREEWTVNGDSLLGYSMILSIARTAITSFNLLCDAVIDRVSILNLESTRDKITKLFKKLNDQLKFQKIVLKEEYFSSKLRELDLMYSLAIVKEEEKEKRRVEAERIKEQEAVNKQLEKEKTKLEKDLKHYEIQQSKGNNVSEQIEKIQNQLKENEYFLTKQKCGYLYIIHNEALGKDVYKIGVTRRLPREADNILQRVDELSNASTPFKFSQNCVIFSEDVFALETALHKEFDKYRVNKINRHKEFFKLPLQDIEKVVKEKYDPSAVFNYSAMDENFVASNWILGENFLDKNSKT